MQFSEKSALVTGAAGRLGARIARTLHQNGANLIIHYRRSAVALAADLGSLDELQQMAAQAAAAFGGLDLLVNNASSFYPTRFGEIDAAQWDDLIASNYRAPLFLAQACYPSLKHSTGSIVNLLDIYASRPLAGHSVYCSAKAAAQMLVRSLALELAPEVRVNGIAPGAILWPENGDDDERRRAIVARVPLARRGDPANIADTVLFLATNDYVTGEVIRVDGGRMLS